MKILALDIGTRRTGCAFADIEMGVPLSLSTLTHTSEDELVEKILLLIDERHIDQIVVGLPLLLSGEEGSQGVTVKRIAQRLSEHTTVHFLDERYTTPNHTSADGDSEAACSILSIYLARNNI